MDRVAEYYNIEDINVISNIQVIGAGEKPFYTRDWSSRNYAVVGLENRLVVVITHTACVEELYGLGEDLGNQRINMYKHIDTDDFWIGHTVEANYWYRMKLGDEVLLYTPTTSDVILVESVEGLLTEDGVSLLCQSYGDAWFMR